MKNREKKILPVEKISIPDEDVIGWIGAYREIGLDQESIDAILVQLNRTFRKLKKKELVEKRHQQVLTYLKEVHHRHLSPSEQDDLKKMIEAGFENE